MTPNRQATHYAAVFVPRTAVPRAASLARVKGGGFTENITRA